MRISFPSNMNVASSKTFWIRTVSKPNNTQCQYAALPVRYGFDGTPEVLLITSRQTRRWVIPKGWPIASQRKHETAMIEAFEEAGLIGNIIRKQPIGTYQYRKTLSPKVAKCLRVSVYLMLITEQLADWPERSERSTRWFSAHHAATLVAEPALARIIRKASVQLRMRSG
jgi:8-oxo-dGTP pyrophosphatase MutT (NUDIX family)